MSSSNESGNADSDAAAPTNPWSSKGNVGDAGKIAGFMASPGVKFILTGFITLALLIPTMLVWGLVEERSRRADDVAASIAQGWGANQTINGPYLVLPYMVSEKVDKHFKQVKRHAIISPSTLSIDGNINVEERKKSIYKTQLYHVKSKLTGTFDAVDLAKIREIGGAPLPSQAFLAMGVSDMTGIRSDISIKLSDAGNRKFSPGLNRIQAPHIVSPVYSRNAYPKHADLRSGGVHLPLADVDIKESMAFEMSFALNGSKDITFVPAGSSTALELNSNWPHPGFDGRFLPENREISAEGFSAVWTVPSLARGIDAVSFSNSLPTANAAIKVNFVEPLKFYQITARTLKYAIAFFSLIFLAMFILELTGRNAIHWVQYVLVGFAMVVFYVMLLAFAEQVGFNIAYAISSVATTALVAWYVGNSLGKKHGSAIMAAILGITYLVMYLILNEEDYALLVGSIIAFGAIAATMAVTRDVDWSSRQVATS
ncbi:MAG: cell envelope integrity protein CreD [Rhizobiaceae bacterium]|nr:cell envelope integrity protein CreD [Rhizobiaceae bacterium]